MDLIEFLRQVDPEIEGLLDKIEALINERKGVNLPRYKIRDKVVGSLDDIYTDAFIKKAGRKFSIWFKNRFMGRKRKLGRD